MEITQREMETLGLQARSALWAVSGHNIIYNAFVRVCDPSLGEFKILVRNTEECILEF